MSWTPQEAADLVKEHYGIRAAARAIGCPESTLRKYYRQAVLAGIAPKLPEGGVSREELKEKFSHLKDPQVDGSVEELSGNSFSVPSSGVKRYLITSVQNNTKVFEPFFENLTALKKHYNADLLVSRFFYMKTGLGASGDKSSIISVRQKTALREFWWDPRLIPYIVDHRVEIAPGLVYCGENNTLPTAVNPLSGMESYTGRASGIFPHVKMALQSVASGRNEPTKFNYTTGALTQRNYIQRKAGIKADFHHCYGALLVEVNSKGQWWVRQIIADNEGTIHDLYIKVEGGKVTTDNQVEAINWGDIHAIQIDPDVENAAWLNDDSMIAELRPKYQFVHDVLDFKGRNHHSRHDPFQALENKLDGSEDVYNEVRLTLEKVREFATIADYAANGCKTVVVDSNHDRALERWIKEADWRGDPVNMKFYLEAALAKVNSILQANRSFHMVRHWAEYLELDEDYIKFLDEDESFIICEDAHGGIECGMHGHLGINGARGSINSFRKMGRKANIGHSHSAGIADGVYQAGTSSLDDLGYNRGPGSWSHSHILTYPNGKRCIITMWKGKWRA